MLNLSGTTQIELIGEVSTYLAVCIQAVCAIVLGGVIGLDREKKLKPAGVKTQILICVGAALYTLVGMSNVPEGFSTYDPNRIAAQIVSGIGFLGAGAIIQSQGRITGMTTAASIWIVAAIGIAVGSGQIFTAMFFTGIIWITLNFVSPILNFVRPQKRFLIQVVGQRKIEDDILSYLQLIEDDDFDLEVFIEDNELREQVNLKVYLSRSELKRLTARLRSIPGVESINSRVY